MRVQVRAAVEHIFTTILNDKHAGKTIDFNEIVIKVLSYRPGTPITTIDRAVRELRKQGLINYTVENGVYTVLPLAGYQG